LVYLLCQQGKVLEKKLRLVKRAVGSVTPLRELEQADTWHVDRMLMDSPIRFEEIRPDVGHATWLPDYTKIGSGSKASGEKAVQGYVDIADASAGFNKVGKPTVRILYPCSIVVSDSPDRVSTSGTIPSRTMIFTLFYAIRLSHCLELIVE
jgi:hypothetical protein